MSRTDKHAPHYVQLNDIGAPALARHDHTLFGKPKVQTRVVRDRSGKVKWQDEPIVMQIAIILRWRPDLVTGTLRSEMLTAQKIAHQALAKGSSPKDYIDTGRTRRAKVTREVTLGRYADYCTAGVATHRDGRIRGQRKLYAPCENELTPEDWGTTWGRGRFERKYRVNADGRLSSRTAVRATRGRLTRLADSGEDLDDIDYDISH
ncbi:hypothetical protein [Microbacterium sp. 77mftsu3.1]|uniref:hypothetical protein n=1 Tax=Microbacterium sp. 77mftsu3.1 TaxID=1761802 RepID=UPI000380D2AB|nr:hypothetical protein [Microbacterium sp. 77mftsu3.1]SDH50576.1 hypothetical protein SAMN04488590_3471 [Microbacterium sp. 77mftsu3.1]